MSAILYRGPSLIDGAPIVVVAISTSSNSKTGDMVQTYIVRDDMKPLDALHTGADVSVCGGCIHRGNGVDGTGRTCYVNLGQGANSVFSKFARDGYSDISNDCTKIIEIGANRYVRLGTYGDPAAVPVKVWHQLLFRAIGHTGYTHQWRSDRLGSPLRGLVMASCDSVADVALAHRKGFAGTFTVVPFGDTLASAELCPASNEAGKVVQCHQCRKCNGSANTIYIPAHGATKKNYTGGRRLPTL